MIVDESLGTDTGGSVRVPSAYCGIFGFRPSHGIISVTGVIPMAQSFDTVGKEQITFQKMASLYSSILHHENLGDHIYHNVPSLQNFISSFSGDQASTMPVLAALSHAMRLLQRSNSVIYIVV
ncbi:hypothetical protein GW17_00011783 [Ensete ventricosum]|nr:hypothetical protein GW17_00011783 [Ensete ventricosum]RZR97428.1 hypothetical protein BHM03_00026604 [Ensete ventricosum]